MHSSRGGLRRHSSSRAALPAAPDPDRSASPWLTRIGLALTREGVRFVLLLGVIGFAAYNTRNNLLYLMLSVALAAVAVSLLSGWISLRGLAATGNDPGEIFVGAPCEEKIYIENRARWPGAYGMEIEEPDPSVGHPRAYLDHLSPSRSRTVSLTKTYRRRGIVETDRLHVRTQFPFGLVAFARKLSLPRRLVVYPRIHRVKASVLERRETGGVPHDRDRGQTEEFLRLRDYTAGDNWHHIHWKKTAKTGRLMVREFASDEDERFCLAFDGVPDPEPAEFERLVSAAASMAFQMAAAGTVYRFVSAEQSFAVGSTREHLRDVLTFLAMVEPHSWDERLRESMEHALRLGERVLLLTLDPDRRTEVPGWHNLVTLRPEDVFLAAGEPGELVPPRSSFGSVA